MSAGALPSSRHQDVSGSASGVVCARRAAAGIASLGQEATLAAQATLGLGAPEAADGRTPSPPKPGTGALSPLHGEDKGLSRGFHTPEEWVRLPPPLPTPRCGSSPEDNRWLGKAAQAFGLLPLLLLEETYPRLNPLEQWIASWPTAVTLAIVAICALATVFVVLLVLSDSPRRRY